MLKSQEVYGQHQASCSAGAASLGRRLFRTLPEDVHDQGPIIGGNGTLVLIADMRLDNRHEIAGRLGIEGRRLGSLCDAALAMQAFERWGENALKAFVGDFALALWDAANRRLLLARDYLGQRPLYYHRNASFLAFASMPKGLHALPEIPYRADAAATLDFVALMPETGTRTFFEGIAKVQAGHVVVMTPDNTVSRAFWEPPRSTLKLRSSSEYAEAVREKLDEAVAARLRGAGAKVGAQLSGGLDSGGVTATAARMLPSNCGEVVAFTAVPRADYALPHRSGFISDEAALAAQVAALYPNVRHVRISAGDVSPVAPLERNFHLYERPLLNLCNGAWLDAIADAAKAEGISVMLIGNKGNFGFSYGGQQLLAELLSRGRLIHLAREALALMRHGNKPRSVAARALAPFLPARLWKLLSRARGQLGGIDQYSWINPEAVEHGGVERRAVQYGLDLAGQPHRDARAARLWGLRRWDLAGYNKGVLGGWGIDLRDPTADRRLVELCLTIPTSEYLKDGETRALARAALSDRLPEAVLHEKRRGYQGADWHEGLTAARAALRKEIAHMAVLPAVRETIDIERLTAAVEQWPQGDWHEPKVIQDYRTALLRAVSAGYFLRKASGTNS